MKGAQIRSLIALTVPLCLLLTACGKKEGAKHDHSKEQAEGKTDDHGHEESPSGASFKAGKGVILTDETRKILGVEMMEVAEAKMPREFTFNVQVFGEKHRHTLNSQDHAGCDVQASGLVSSNTRAIVKAGQTVNALKGTNLVASGVVLSMQKGLTLGEPEIVIGLSNASSVLKPGEFVSASISIPREEAVMVVPRSAVLKTSEGTFVYAANGDAYLRTPVVVGSQSGGLAEITDGLLPGDQVVVKAVETLWLIELRATKGGGHSH
ncbi:MAG: efflux RND transporter periplasmic adaptor subunit [Verrucomicrobiota bacterium]|nr:efflux RND transporter periplasmic adaptor subunit [Verrucomicrobiota bacterium]